jgi:hypothetical protein
MPITYTVEVENLHTFRTTSYIINITSSMHPKIKMFFNLILSQAILNWIKFLRTKISHDINLAHHSLRLWYYCEYKTIFSKDKIKKLVKYKTLYIVGRESTLINEKQLNDVFISHIDK